jgi:hypothetical protein
MIGQRGKYASVKADPKNSVVEDSITIFTIITYLVYIVWVIFIIGPYSVGDPFFIIYITIFLG